MFLQLKQRLSLYLNKVSIPGYGSGLYLVVVLQQDPDHTLHALRLHRFACEVQQVLQGIRGVGGLTEVNVQSCRLAGFGQTKLLGRSFFMRNLWA